PDRTAARAPTATRAPGGRPARRRPAAAAAPSAAARTRTATRRSRGAARCRRASVPRRSLSRASGGPIRVTDRLAELMRGQRVLVAAVVARDHVEVVVADPVLG